MRDYSKMSPRLYTGKLGIAMRGDAHCQALAPYLIGGPHSNMIALYHLPIAYICNDLGWPFKGASKALRRVSEGGLVRYDEANERVWVVEHARIEFGEELKRGDNRIKGIERLLDDHRNSFLYNEFIARYGECFHLTVKPLRSPLQGPSKPLGKPLRSQDQDQDQESKNTSEDGGAPGTVNGEPPRKLTGQQKAVEFVEQVMRDHGVEPASPPTIAKWLTMVDGGEFLSIMEELSGGGKLEGMKGRDLTAYIFGCVKNYDSKRPASQRQMLLEKRGSH